MRGKERKEGKKKEERISEDTWWSFAVAAMALDLVDFCSPMAGSS